VSILCDVDKHGKSKDVGHGDDRRVLDDDSSSLRLDLAVAIRDPDRNPRGIAAVCEHALEDSSAGNATAEASATVIERSLVHALGGRNPRRLYIWPHTVGYNYVTDFDTTCRKSSRAYSRQYQELT